MRESRAKVLAIQNDPTDPPLMVGDWLAEVGIDVEVVEAFAGQETPRHVPHDVHGILALGGSMGANDHDDAPWLPAEKSLLRDATERGVPVLGLCLGGQLLAEATGGRVTLGPVTEIGLAWVTRTQEGDDDPVVGAAVPVSGGDLPAAHWHQDHVEALPPDAVLLMTNDDCRVQAFRVGAASYGLQLHPEINGAVFRWWADYVDEALRRSGVDPLAAAVEVEAMDDELVRAWKPMTRAWAELVLDHAGLTESGTS